MLQVFLALVVVGATASLSPVQGQSTVATDAARLDHVADEVDEAVVDGDWAGAASEWAELNELWEKVEDGFRAQNREGYRAIEATMRTISGLLTASSPDPDGIRAEIAKLRSQIEPFSR